MKKEFEIVAGRNWKWWNQTLYTKHKRFEDAELEVIISKDLSNKLHFEKGTKYKMIITDERG